MWYTNFGNQGDIVLSSRVRLARNISGIPFMPKMTEADLKTVTQKCKGALPRLKYIAMDDLPPAHRTALAECHLISPQMAKNLPGQGVLTNESLRISVMLGEEDHIRIQAMTEGLNLDFCMEKALEVHNMLENEMDLAFDSTLGYLTCCPTNVGTGIRASVMVHLPGLSETGKIDSLIRWLSKIGFTVRGIYGEGSQALGNIFQISNQITLGITEENILEKLKSIVEEIIEMEHNAQQNMYQNNRLLLEDRILRSKGILTNSGMMSSGEAIKLISDVRLGINLGIIKDIDHITLARALYETMPGNIAKNYNLTSGAERDLKRSRLLSEILTERKD